MGTEEGGLAFLCHAMTDLEQLRKDVPWKLLAWPKCECRTASVHVFLPADCSRQLPRLKCIVLWGLCKLTDVSSMYGMGIKSIDGADNLLAEQVKSLA